ncbi:hypothetical protein ABTW96_34120 [Nocardia beijingensis]|uniref:hypothetical protein n=1 Tax=Nocardia beijingensis TaxID=95162 RepID=UPI003330DD4B
MNTAAQWFTGPNRRRSWIAVLVVAVVVGVAAVVWADRSPRQSQQATTVSGGKFRIETALGSAPTPRWTVRAADLSTDPGAVLLSAPHSLNVYYGNGTPMDAGTTIVAATAVPDSAGGGVGQPVSAVRLHGIDPDTGKPQWTIDVGAIASCAEQVFQGLLSCWDTHRVLIVDSATGTVLTDHITDFEVEQVDARDGVVTVAGRTADWQTAVFTRGTVSDIAASWRKTFPTVVPGEPVRPVISAPDYFRNGRHGNIRVYDLRTGEPLFHRTGRICLRRRHDRLAGDRSQRHRGTGRVARPRRTPHHRGRQCQLHALPPSGDPRVHSQVRAMGGRMVTVTAHEFTGYAAA